MLRINFFLFLILLFVSCSVTKQPNSKKRVFLNTHADIRDTLTVLRSKVISTAKILKKELPDADLKKKARDKYNTIIAGVEGFVSRYETIVDKPIILNDQINAINSKLTSISKDSKEFREFYEKEFLNKKTMGEATSPVLWGDTAKTIYELGKQLIVDISNAKTAEKARYKEEANRFKLPEWDDL